jgi:hypothetical protein
VAESLSLLSRIACPSLHIVFLRIVRTACILLHQYEGSSALEGVQCAQALLLGQCQVAVGPVISGSHAMEEPLPYAPVLYREGMIDLTYYSLLQSYKMDVSQLESAFKDPFSTYPAPQLLGLLSHSISEVREGILLGCQRALLIVASDEKKSSSSATQDPFGSYLLLRTELLEQLISRLVLETEPPLRHLVLQVMCRYLCDTCSALSQKRQILLTDCELSLL